MRCFIAMELPGAISRALGRFTEGLAARCGQRKAMWVRPANLHLTLRFLGETTSAQHCALTEDLAGVCAASARGPLAVRGTGGFPLPPCARVLWAGIDDTTGILHALQAAVEAAAQRAGFAPESRPFRPHITLARYRADRQSAETVAWLSENAATPFGEFIPDAVTLFVSELGGGPPIHRALARFPLAPPRTVQNPVV